MENIEIERKYLVKDSSYREMAVSQSRIVQGYLSARKEATVRVRICDDKAYLTVKGLTEGISRKEFEYEIPVKDAEEMMSLCGGKFIDKTRYLVQFGGYTWEVDEFQGPLEGLVIAEIELPSEDSAFPLPPFIGKEVSADPQYYNSNLINR